MARPVTDGFNALWNKKYPYKTQYLERAQTLEELLFKLKEHDDN